MANIDTLRGSPLSLKDTDISQTSHGRITKPDIIPERVGWFRGALPTEPAPFRNEVNPPNGAVTRLGGTEVHSLFTADRGPMMGTNNYESNARFPCCPVPESTYCPERGSRICIPQKPAPIRRGPKKDPRKK